GHERVVERRPVLRDALDARRRPLARAPGGPCQGGDGHQPPPARRAGRRLGDARWRQGTRDGREDRQPRAGQEGRRRARQERALARDVPDPAPLRPRRLPGAAGRRAHGARQRTRREVRGAPGRRRPRVRAARDRGDDRVRAEHARRRLDWRHAPGDPGDAHPHEPLPVHEVTMTTERTTEVVSDLLAAVHEVLERHRVTEEEWMAALMFLTEVGKADEFVLLSDVTRTSVLIDALSHADDESGATASDVEGPMYTTEPPFRTKIYEEYEGMSPDDDVLFVRGRVTSTAGEPLPG